MRRQPVKPTQNVFITYERNQGYRTPEFALLFKMPDGFSERKNDMVPRAGLEPARPEGQRILSPLRLPIPPPGQPGHYRITGLCQTPSATMALPRNAIRTAEASKLIPAIAPVYSSIYLCVTAFG